MASGGTKKGSGSKGMKKRPVGKQGDQHKPANATRGYPDGHQKSVGNGGMTWPNDATKL
jgi:hypothetical protein